MPRRLVLLLALLAAAAAHAADDGKAVFERREDTMKQMGKPFYLGLGRVVKGTQPFGPETVAAAETVASLAQRIEPALFAPGSDVGGTKMKPDIFKDPARVAELARQAREAVARLPAAAASGDKAQLATAYGAANEACLACHKAFRNED